MSAAPKRRARAVVFAAALALLAMLGVASGFWPVAHHVTGHADPASHAPDSRPCHDQDRDPLTSDETPPFTDYDCPICDLIVGSQTVSLMQALSTLRPAALAVPALAYAHGPPARQIDLTAWSARPPPVHL